MLDVAKAEPGRSLAPRSSSLNCLLGAAVFIECCEEAGEETARFALKPKQGCEGHKALSRVSSESDKSRQSSTVRCQLAGRIARLEKPTVVTTDQRANTRLQEPPNSWGSREACPRIRHKGAIQCPSQLSHLYLSTCFQAIRPGSFWPVSPKWLGDSTSTRAMAVCCPHYARRQLLGRRWRHLPPSDKASFTISASGQRGPASTKARKGSTPVESCFFLVRSVRT